MQVLNVLGRGASSVVSSVVPGTGYGHHVTVVLGGFTLRLGLLQVMKAFYLKGSSFVAIKRINAFEKVWPVFYVLSNTEFSCS